MSVEGDATDWLQVFPEELLPTILDYLIETWEGMAKPDADELESTISSRVYRELLRNKRRNEHPFLIRHEDWELAEDSSAEPGRKDIVFFPGCDEKVYFCLECKRLNVQESGKWRSLADLYVKEGLKRFVDGKYARAVRHGGMLAYVLDGQIDRAIRNVEENIRAQCGTLGMQHFSGMKESTVRPGDPCVRETEHQRERAPREILIHHLFLAGTSAKRPRKKLRS